MLNTHPSDHLRTHTIIREVPVRGAGTHVRHELNAVDPAGVSVTLTSDSLMPLRSDDLAPMLAGESTEAWAGVSIGHGQVDLSGMLLWLTTHEPEWCGAMSPAGGVLHPDKVLTLWPNALVTYDGFATLTMRYLSNTAGNTDPGYELGARGFGAEGATAAARVIALLQAWDRAGRPSEPEIRYLPRGARLPEAADGSLLLKKKHGHVAITWTARQ